MLIRTLSIGATRSGKTAFLNRLAVSYSCFTIVFQTLLFFKMSFTKDDTFSEDIPSTIGVDFVGFQIKL